jgi:hypothetical protein
MRWTSVQGFDVPRGITARAFHSWTCGACRCGCSRGRWMDWISSDLTTVLLPGRDEQRRYCMLGARTHRGVPHHTQARASLSYRGVGTRRTALPTLPIQSTGDLSTPRAVDWLGRTHERLAQTLRDGCAVTYCIEELRRQTLPVRQRLQERACPVSRPAHRSRNGYPEVVAAFIVRNLARKNRSVLLPDRCREERPS